MTSTSSAVAPAKAQTLADLFAAQSGCGMHIYSKRQIIYKPGDAAAHIFFILHGRVKVSRPVRTTKQTVIDIYIPGQFFGESALVSGLRLEEAIVVENVKVLVCPASEIIQFVSARSGAGLALLQEVTRRSLEVVTRLESVFVGNTQRRLARVLLVFGDRFGIRGDDGTLRLPPLSHALLSDCTGTSREVVTANMKEFRRTGEVLRFSRREIVIAESNLRRRLQPPKRSGG